MSGSSLERLFWEEFDGPPSAPRRERIEALLRERPESRRELDGLEELATALQNVEELPPPPELKTAIRQAIANRPDPSTGPKIAVGSWLGPVLAAGWRVRLAYATLGALIAVVATGLIPGGLWSSLSEADRSRLSGAMNVGTAAAPEAYELVLDEAAGTLRFFRDGAHLVATLLPSPNKTLELSLNSEDGSLQLLRVEEIRATRHEVAAERGTVRLVADGPVSIVLHFDAAGSPTLAATVSAGAGAILLERRVDLERLGYGG